MLTLRRAFITWRLSFSASSFQRYLDLGRRLDVAFQALPEYQTQSHVSENGKSIIFSHKNQWKKRFGASFC
jgi:hypothetical protein